MKMRDGCPTTDGVMRKGLLLRRWLELTPTLSGAALAPDL
jgi:hypothetical protein